MPYYTIEPGHYSDGKSENSNDEFIGNGWSIRKLDNAYYFEYLSGAMQGELKTIEITSDDNQKLRDGKIGLDDICIKYNIY
ncbi:MAG: hypothetical protein ACRCYO_17695 [Bacteroidia bacterium]